MHLTVGMGNKSMHLLLLSLANIHSSIHMKAMSNAFALVAYIPSYSKVSKHFASYPSSSSCMGVSFCSLDCDGEPEEGRPIRQSYVRSQRWPPTSPYTSCFLDCGSSRTTHDLLCVFKEFTSLHSYCWALREWNSIPSSSPTTDSWCYSRSM